MGRWIAQLNIGIDKIDQARLAVRTLQETRMVLSQINWVMFSGIFWIWTLERVAKAADDYRDALTGVLRAEISLADVEFRRQQILYQIAAAQTAGDLAEENALRSELIRVEIDATMASINLAKARRDEESAARTLLTTQMMLGIQTTMSTLMLGNTIVSLIQATTRIWALTAATGHAVSLTQAFRLLSLGVDGATAAIERQSATMGVATVVSTAYRDSIGAATTVNTGLAASNYAVGISFKALFATVAPFLAVLGGLIWGYTVLRQADDETKKSIISQSATLDEARQKWMEYREAQARSLDPEAVSTEWARPKWLAEITEEEYKQLKLQTDLDGLMAKSLELWKASEDQIKKNTTSMVDYRRAIEAALEIAMPTPETIRSRMMGPGSIAETLGRPSIPLETQEMMYDYFANFGSMTPGRAQISNPTTSGTTITTNIYIDKLLNPADAEYLADLISKKQAEQAKNVTP